VTALKLTIKPENAFLALQTVGLGLLVLLWTTQGELAGFFLILTLALLAVLRWRFAQLRATIILDLALCILLFPLWPAALFALLLPLLEGMYRRFYGAALIALLSLYHVGLVWGYVLMLALTALAGTFLAQWQREQKEKIQMRDTKAGQLYELQELQDDVMTNLAQIERTTAVSERARIARDIHDNAGHEIVAAYISLQTTRDLLHEKGEKPANSETLELFDAALARLDKGVNQIRETAHNLQTVSTLGVENMLEICERFPACDVKFSAYGDTSLIPVYAWNVLESCLNESLTNVGRHAHASYVKVELGVTAHLTRLSIENDGAQGSSAQPGSGLRNLRHRVIAAGGTIAVDAGETFRVVCVIPLREETEPRP